MKMNGQWLGKYQGTSSGTLMIDLDDQGKVLEGIACVFDDNALNISTQALIQIPKDRTSAQLEVDVHPIDPRNGNSTTWGDLKKLFPDLVHSTKAQVKLQLEEGSLAVEWTTDIGHTGSAKLPKSKASHPSESRPLAEVKTWEDFKNYVSRLDYRQYIFRGQQEPWRLRTSFHRTGRADLSRFLTKDRIALHRHLSHRTRHLFNLDVPEQNGAFFNLLQHHGYPTPLLDWTYSPYVSAFFAYRLIKNSDAELAHDDKKVRIFMFDQEAWCTRFLQMVKLNGPPHFSIMEFLAIENERMVPQQSISSVTNVDDIEDYIRQMEVTSGIEFLKVIDLPLKERPHVMRELTAMGITAGSLFPGLDGACEELRERFFRL